MSNPNPSPENQFKPGQSGNPNGPQPTPEDLKKAKKLAKGDFDRILYRFLSMTKDELVSSMRDPGATTLELMVGRIVTEGIKKGDTKHLTFILDRSIGPIKTKVSIDGGDTAIALTVGRADPIDVEERIKLLKESAPAKIEGQK